MKLVINLLLKTSFFFSLLLWSFSSHAETSQQSDDLITFEEVITAKRSLLLQNSASERKITDDQFNIQKPQNLESVLKQLPSLSISDPYNSTVGVFFRGADSEKILVLLDGVVMNDPTSPSGGFDYRFLQPSEIEEIKIWSPGEAVAWGPGALGGIISLTTKKKSQRSLAASMGYFKTAQLGFSYGIEQEKWTTNLSFSGLQSEGVSVAAPWTGASELDGRTRSNARLFATHQGENSLQRVQLFYSSGIESTDRNPPADDPNSFTNYQNSIFSFQDQRSTDAGSEIYSTFAIKKIIRSESDAPDSLNSSFAYSKEEANELQARVQYLGRLNEQTKLDTGIDSEETSATFESLDSTPATSSFSKRSSDTGLFFRLHHQRDQLKLIPGLRAQLNAENQVNPMSTLRVEWDFLDSLQFEYHAATGIKQPTLYQRYSNYGNSSLAAEKVEYHHFGIVQSTAVNKFLFLIFQSWSKDLIQFNSGSSKYENISSANLKGAEFQFTRDFGRAKVNFSGTEVYAQDGQGISLTRRPRQQLSLSSDHFSGKFRFAPMFLWKGQREDSASGARVVLPSYTQFDFGLSYYQQANLHIEGALRNILGQDTSEAYGYQGLGRRTEIGLRYFW